MKVLFQLALQSPSNAREQHALFTLNGTEPELLSLGAPVLTPLILAKMAAVKKFLQSLTPRMSLEERGTV